MTQTSYSLNPDSLKLGSLSYVGEPYSALSCDNLTHEVAFGHLVAKTTGADLTVEPFTNPNQAQYGVALLDETVAIDETTTLDNAYPVNSKVGVLKSGYVSVKVDQTIVSGDAVYARHSSTLAVQTIVFSADIVASNSIACSVNGDALTATVYATSNAATLTAFAAKIEAHEDVLTAVSDGTHTITVTSVSAVAITFTGPTVTLGASQATATITTTVAGVAGDQGVFRKDSDSNKASLVSGAEFITSASSGGLAVLKVSL